MESKRTFSDSELDQLGAVTSDLVHQAIAEGDVGGAHELLDRLVRETRGIHDSYLVWIASMQSFIYREYGEDAFHRSQLESYGKAASVWSKELAGSPNFKELVETRALMIRTHAVPLDIQEDDEKVCIRMQKCGSGARLLDMGFYDGGGGERIREARPYTFNREGFPVYCTHCAIMQAQSVEKGLSLDKATIPVNDLQTGLCQFNIYKRGHSAPESHVDSLRARNEQAEVGGSSQDEVD
jgi:hypothetical protein